MKGGSLLGVPNGQPFPKVLDPRLHPLHHDVGPPSVIRQLVPHPGIQILCRVLQDRAGMAEAALKRQRKYIHRKTNHAQKYNFQRKTFLNAENL
jgi:hypothetical protein